MPKLEKLKELATQEIRPLPPSWALVYHFLMKNDDPSQENPGAAVAASGESSIFSYARDSIEPMYFCTIGGIRRLETCSSYKVNSLRSTDADTVFEFIREAIDAGQGLFMAGPEIGLCYGYEESSKKAGRRLFGYANWGPAFNGEVPWEMFVKYVENFGEAEGFGYLSPASSPGPAETILEMLCAMVIDWQTEHPAIQFGMSQEYYGLSAFRTFIDDFSDPAIRPQIDQAYLDCHVIRFQAGGRYWLGRYLDQIALQFRGDMKSRLKTIGNLYNGIHLKLSQFSEINAQKDTEQIKCAADLLQDAYENDEKILANCIALRKLI